MARLTITHIECAECMRDRKVYVCVGQQPGPGSNCREVTLCPSNIPGAPLAPPTTEIDFYIPGNLKVYESQNPDPIYTSSISFSTMKNSYGNICLYSESILEFIPCPLCLRYRINANFFARTLSLFVIIGTTFVEYFTGFFRLFSSQEISSSNKSREKKL